MGSRRQEGDDPVGIMAGMAAHDGSGDSKQHQLGWNELVRRQWRRVGLGQERVSTTPGDDNEGRPEAKSTSRRRYCGLKDPSQLGCNRHNSSGWEGAIRWRWTVIIKRRWSEGEGEIGHDGGQRWPEDGDSQHRCRGGDWRSNDP